MKQSIAVIMMLSMIALAAVAQEKDKDSTSLGESMQLVSTKYQPKIGGLIQFWNVYQAKIAYGNPPDDNFDLFRFRRVEIKATGSINDRVGYGAMADFAKDGNVLQDAFIKLMLSSSFVITAGQFKYPLTYEGLQSSGNLDFVERAEITRVFGDRRDLGVQVSGTIHSLSYAIGMFNGNGPNYPDDNREKDLAGRVTYRLADEFSFGCSGYFGRRSVSHSYSPYHRAAFEALYDAHPIKIFGEALWAREREIEPFDNMGAVYIAFLYLVSASVQMGTRYEYANEHMELARVFPLHRYTLGINYFLDEQRTARVQLNYVLSRQRDYEYFQQFFGYYWNNYLYLNLQVAFQ